MSKRPATGVGIVGMGSFLPDAIRTNDWWPEDWRRQFDVRLGSDVMGTLDEAAHRGSAEVDPEVARYAGAYFADPFRGSKERRVMDPATRPSNMETAACLAALDDAGVAPEEVDALLGFGLVTDNVAVENAPVVAHNLGLRTDVSALDVAAACASFPHQIRVAASLVASGEHDVVLAYVSSAASAVTNYAAPSSVVTGDGATAVVIRRVEPGYGYIATTTSTQGEMSRGILIVPHEKPDNPWYACESSRFVIRRMDAKAAHFAGAHAASSCRVVVEQLFEKTGYRAEDVDFFAVSQAGAWFPRALADAIGIDHSKILGPEVQFERYGHMFAASAPLNLEIAWRTGRVKKGALVLVFSPGVGFVTAATLLRWNLEDGASRRPPAAPRS